MRLSDDTSQTCNTWHLAAESEDNKNAVVRLSLHKFEMDSHFHIALLPCESEFHEGSEHHIPRALENKAYLINSILIWVG